MTIASSKDLLFTTFEEYDTAQQRAGMARSKMHCIIASLPDEIKPENIGAPSASCVIEPTIALSQNDRYCAKQALRPLLETECRAKDRPVVRVTAPQSVVADVQSVFLSTGESKPAAEKKAKKTRAKRVSEVDIRKAVKLVYDEDITQKEAENACRLPRGTLSKRKGKEIMSQYRREWGTPTIIDTQRGVSRKDLEKAWLHGDDC